MSLALCTSYATPDDWFADPATEPERVARAVRICHSCPMMSECAELASENEYGVWGGIVVQPPADLPDVRHATAGRPKWRPEFELDFVGKMKDGASAADLGAIYGVAPRTIERFAAERGLHFTGGSREPSTLSAIRNQERRRACITR